MNILGDKRKAITAEDLIRRYDLDKLKSDRKAITTLNDGLTKTNTNLENYVTAVTKDIKDLQDQVDGNITTWFYNGIPTLDNEPAVNWATEEEKINHLGDLYYDQDTGYAYRWAMIDNKFEWNKIIDADVVEALALANAAQDTADQKRRTFFNEPTTPYDSGDIWIYQGEIYRCIRSRSDGEWNTADWVNDLIYTDDTLANKALTDLENFAQEVRDEYVTNKIFEETSNSLSSTIESVQIEVGKKNTVFREQPTTPYIIGDTWIQNEKVYVCKNPRAEGDFVESDWELNLDGGKFATKTQVEQTDDKVSILANQVSDIEVELTTSKTASGNPIEITDAGPYPLKSIEIEGKSYQETRSCKNLFCFNNVSGTKNGITYNWEGNKLTLNGTATAATDIYNFGSWGATTQNEKRLVKAGTYISSVQGANNVGRFNTGCYYGTTVLFSLYEESSDIHIITEDMYYSNFYIGVKNGATFNNEIFYFQLEEGEVVTEFEQYGVSPSPEYPSEINTVQGITNYVDWNNIEKRNRDFSAAANVGGAYSYYATTKGLQFFIPVSKFVGKIMTYSYNPKYGYVRLYFCDNEYKHLALTSDYVITNKSNERSLIIPEGTSYINVVMMTSDTSSLREDISLDVDDTKFMLLEGEQFGKKYISYGRWLEQITTNKNFIGNNNLATKTMNGVTFTPVFENGELQYINVNGTATATAYIDWGYNAGLDTDSYILTGCPTGGDTAHYFLAVISLPNYITAGYDRGEGVTVNLTNGINYYFRVRIAAGYTANNLKFYPMLRKSSVGDSAYEPYRKNTALIDLNKVNKFGSDLIAGSYNTTTGVFSSSGSSTTLASEIQDIEFDKIHYLKNVSGSVRVLYWNNNEFVSSEVITAPNTFKTLGNKYAIQFGNTLPYDDIKIYEGIGIDDYYEFASINDTKDKFKNKTYTQRIGKVVLDGSQSVTVAADSTNTLRISFFTIFNEVNKGLANDTSLLCTHLEGKINWSEDVEGIYINSNALVMRINKSTMGITTADYVAVNKWLSENPITVYYRLAAPITHDLNYEKLELHEGYNRITLNDDLLPNMEIEYLTNVSSNEEYATKGELLIESNTIKQSVTAEIEGLDKKIEGGLELKVDLKELMSIINLNADLINLISDKLVIQSAKFKLSEGVMQAMGGTIGSVEIGENYLRIPITVEYDFTQDDIDKVYAYVRGTGTLTDEELIKYDLNKDGIVNVYDVSAINSVIKTGITTISPGYFVIEVNKDMPLYSGLYITDGHGAKKISFNFNGINVNGIDIESSITELYNRFGLLGLCTKLEAGINDSGHFYIRGTMANGVQYQLNCTNTDFRFQKYENGAWTNIWSK